MSILKFPDKTKVENYANTEICFDEFRGSIDELDVRGRGYATGYSKDPQSVTQKNVETLIVDTYKLTIELLDAKVRQGGKLINEEKEIYDRCKKAVTTYNSNSPPYNSLWGVLLNAIEKVRDCIDDVKDWFGLSSDADKANKVLIDAGTQLLPNYKNLIIGGFSDIIEFFMPLFTPTIIEMADAQLTCALNYQKTLTIDKSFSSLMLKTADYGYRGCKTNIQNEFAKLAETEVPSSIRLLYDKETGLLNCTRGLRAWLGKRGQEIVIAFSGTDTSSFDMIFADIVQLSQPSTLYLKAAGLVKVIIAAFSNHTVYTTGHSLGGGLSQFSLTANMSNSKLSGYAFNPAGLSKISLDHLTNTRLVAAKEKVRVFMTAYDPVSTFGGKIGCLVTLPKTAKNGHGIDDLKVCMEEYLRAQQTASELITLNFRNHSESDFIPYTSKLSLQSSASAVYPIFNANSTISAEKFLSTKMSLPLFNKLELSKTATDYCLGVYNKFNGTAHTVINRLLLMTDGNPTKTIKSRGNIHSSIIYGKYGLGVKNYAAILKDAYVNSNEIFISATSYEKMLATLQNPFDDDKSAWIEGIRVEFGIQMQNVFNKYPLAEAEFDKFIIKLTSDRMDLYQSIYKDRAPTAAEKKSFITAYSDMAQKAAAALMQQAVLAKVITASQKTQYQVAIKNFADKVISTF